MGLVPSICKCKKRVRTDSSGHDTYTQRSILKRDTSISRECEQTQCSAISREPIKNSTVRYHYYLPQEKQIYTTSMKSIRGDPDLPLFSTPFYIPFNGKNDCSSSHCSDSHVARAYSHKPVSISPSTDHAVRECTKSHMNTGDSTSIVPVVSKLQTVRDAQTNNVSQSVTHANTLVSVDEHHSFLKSSLDNGAHIDEHSDSVPIDVFLIDISNEHVLIGQSISMNIRHLLLDTLEQQKNNPLSASALSKATIASIPTDVHENLLDYIPHVCEQYANVTVESDQLTRHALHIHVPSYYSQSFKA
jgi:hypothetical protein